MIVRSDILSVKLLDNEAFFGFRVRRTWQAPLREDQKKPVMGLYVLLEPVASA